MKIHVVLRHLALGSAFLLAACAGDQSVNREANLALEPMAKPASPPAENQFQGLGASSAKLTGSQAGKLYWEVFDGDDVGCSFDNDGWFAPSEKWTDCGGSTGTQSFTKSGDIWPLKVGNTESYDITGKDQQYDWQTTRRCEVKDAVTLTVAETAYPTYEVVCSDRFNVRTWYVSPDLQRIIRFKRYNNSRGLLTDMTAVL